MISHGKNASLAVASGLLVGWAVSCGGGMTATDTANVALYSTEQLACVEVNAPDRAKIDACRSANSDKWMRRWSAEGGPFFDGGAQ